MSVSSQSQNAASPQSQPARNASGGPAFLFDFDGTLLDSVYQHVLAWHEALLKAGIELSVWRIHRRIGMSGGLLVNALSRETGRRLTDEEARQLQQWHAEAYLNQMKQVRALPGARDLLAYLTTSGTPWAIATSGRMQTAGPNLAVLGIGSDIPIITRDQVARAKPDPDLFLAAAELLKVPISSSVVVGDSVWDMLAARRAGALGARIVSTTIRRTSSGISMRSESEKRTELHNLFCPATAFLDWYVHCD